MALADLLHQDVTILAAGERMSRAGDPEPDWSRPVTVAVVRGWVQSRRSMEDESLRNRRAERGRLYVQVDAPVMSSSRVLVDGQLWELIGPPRKVFTPSGPHHIEADVEYLRG